MDLNLFHFANPYWFLGLLFIPLLWVLYALYYESNANIKDLEKFADKHLIPHLLRNSKSGQISIWRSLTLGSVLWICLIAAMAGPRWDYREVKSFSDDKTLLILLDLSKSMDADDIKPTRLSRARQEIEDIINSSLGIKIGLVGFAANAHMISPITDDMNNIRHLLPLLGTDLVFVQGTKLTPALKTAKQMLYAEPGNNKSILIISDGGFQDSDSKEVLADFTSSGIAIHTIGVASDKGINFVDLDGNAIIRNGQVVSSRLEKEKLEAISFATKGQYFNSHYSSDNAKNILRLVEGGVFGIGEQQQNVQHWEERFYIFIFPVLLVILLWFRRGFTFPIILLVLLTPVHQANAISKLDKIFLNKEQLAKKAFEEIDDIDTALTTFDDPYKRGVAYYKAGKFKQAERAFRKNKRSEVQESAMYNLANSLAHQNKLEEAVDTYRQLLSQNPNHEKTKHNMGVVQAMIVIPVEKEKEESKKKEDSDDGDLLGGGGGGSDDNDEDEGGGDDGNDEDGGDDGSSETDKEEGDNSEEDGDGKDNQGDEDDDGDKREDESSGSDDKDGKEGKGDISESEIDQMLDLISSDHKNFLKNQFYMESYNSQTEAMSDPW